MVLFSSFENSLFFLLYDNWIKFRRQCPNIEMNHFHIFNEITMDIFYVAIEEIVPHSLCTTLQKLTWGRSFFWPYITFGKVFWKPFNCVCMKWYQNWNGVWKGNRILKISTASLWNSKYGVIDASRNFLRRKFTKPGLIHLIYNLSNNCIEIREDTFSSLWELNVTVIWKVCQIYSVSNLVIAFLSLILD